MHRKKIVVSLMALFVLALVSAFGASNKVKGMITTRTGETLVVRSAQGNVTVVLTDETTTKDDRGLLGFRKERMSNVVLIPGLKVDVDGTSDDQGRVVAKTITVDGDDLETAQMIQAGLHPTAEQVAANMQSIDTNQQNIATNKQQLAAQKRRLAAQQGQLTSQQGELTTQKGQLATQKESVESNRKNIAGNQQQIAANIKDIEENTNRFTALSEYDVKGAGTVKFNVGSATISPKDQAELKRLAQTAMGLKGYIIEVMGYADSTGDAAMNTKLSEDRAKAVVTFLMQQGGVPVRHIVAPGAMGEYAPVAPNETKAGRAENRRVDIKVLVNKGLAGA